MHIHKLNHIVYALNLLAVDFSHNMTY